MIKYMMLIGTMLLSSSCTPQTMPVTKPLYPYRDTSGLFGYADADLHIIIKPQYQSASLFSGQGFAVVTDSLDKKGVIDKNNKFILAADYDNVHLFDLDDFTLAEVRKSYYSRLRFWEWRFLPGFNIMGSSHDNRLFDSKVERLKRTVFILGDKPQKIRSERITDSRFITDKYFNISALDSNQVLINGTLYDVGTKGAHSLTRGIKEPLTENTFARKEGKSLYILDRKGKKTVQQPYILLDSIVFKVEDLPVVVHFSEDNYQRITDAYQDGEGNVFIYPDFSKPLPRLIHDNMHPDDPTAEELIRGLWMLASVPESDYFLFMSYRDGKRFFRFLDTQGNWHQTLPPGIPFTVVQRSGHILWPGKEYYIPEDEVPEGWKIDRISPLSDSSMYHITLQQDKTVRQGIWDFEKKQWLIAPEYYQIYTLGNTRQWRYEPEYGGLWGIMDHSGNVLLKPTYSSLHPDGWVTQEENGEYISFYLHLPTLTEFREK